MTLPLAWFQIDAVAGATVLETLRLDLLAKLVLAVILGGAIGLERELSAKPAGLRTNILICVGSAMLMDLSVRIGVVDGTRHGDPARLAAQVVSGIGFLGAGTILQSRGAIVGLTTAATIWVVAAIGLTIGAGAFFEATGAAAIVTLVLAGLGKVERQLHVRRRVVSGTLRVTRGVPFERFEEFFLANGIAIHALRVHEQGETTTFELKTAGPVRMYDVLTASLMRRDDVLSVQFD